MEITCTRCRKTVRVENPLLHLHTVGHFQHVCGSLIRVEAISVEPILKTGVTA